MVRLPPQNSRTLLQRGGSSFATSQQRFSLASSLPKFQEGGADDAKYFRPSSKRNARSLSVRDARLAVGVAVAHVTAAHLAAARLATVTTTTMPACMPATMTTTVCRGRGRGVGGSGAAVGGLREGQRAEGQHKNEGQNDSEFISHCSILLVIMIKVLLQWERDAEGFPCDRDRESSRSCLWSEQRSCHSSPRVKSGNFLYLSGKSFRTRRQKLWR
jgi:hypothetical protein